MKIQDVHIVILSSIKWDFLWQRHQIIAEYFSQFTHVTYVETTGLRNPAPFKAVERLYRGMSLNRKRKKRESGSNVNILPPIVAPPTLKLFRTINQHIFTPSLASKILNYSNKPILFITYLPTSTSLYLMDELNPITTIYDCVLNFENFPGIPKDIVQTENELIHKADALIVDSKHLFEKHTGKKAVIRRIPSAVDFESFSRAAGLAHGESSKSGGGKVKATYFGGIDQYRMDWGVIEELLKAGITVELIGPAPDGIPIKHGQLIHQKPLPHEQLPYALQDSDVLILPYKLTEFTKGTYPAKLFECFATGKPIVATPLPDLIPYGDLIEIADSPSLFTEKVLAAVSRDDVLKRTSRIDLARENSWEVRCQSYEQVLEEVLFEVSLNELVKIGSRGRD
ncbi:hypothetical protein ACOQFO_13740 [Ureibacillus sp. MALMAid1270]|uniref:hypothetical protein n=1 Tax=Ureibacillus sp. MALMAid1270 TaxID=3411629 RepID=UPI003BA79E4C